MGNGTYVLLIGQRHLLINPLRNHQLMSKVRCKRREGDLTVLEEVPIEEDLYSEEDIEEYFEDEDDDEEEK